MAKKTTKEPELLMTVPVREVYIHKYVGKVQAVDVAVFIDYKNNSIGLIDSTDSRYPDISKAKPWVFANRGLEYMSGWLDILDAMKDAVKTAQGKLSIYQKERELERAMEIMEASKENDHNDR